ncbi:tetraacyldisaccharide 4'-kinase [Oceanibium sediminis]|uniref:tetraacyldisaccharide 4'-kinase n=1 Tax=Oceanibium sediminis TaxID=2026339 RepID=UPI000DD2EEDC|nr:tetraacyldisaccharide 4'-kinase [Oceanibium sediminis]
MRRAPDFWANPPDAPGLAARLLTPLSALWRWRTARRIASGPGERPGPPVICVGNLTAGGSGKTPVVSALLQRIDGAVALSRGYGGTLEGPVAVDPARHTAGQVGDEPILLSGFGPVWVARDRAAGARAAAKAGARAIVMDDGFQNPALAKDLSIVVIDAAAGFGNGRIIPAGPLREPVEPGLRRADFVLILGTPARRARFLEQHPQIAARPVLQGALKPLQTGMPWQDLRCLAFAGIGRPAKFFESLRAVGADVVATRSFSDHAQYPEPMLRRLLAEAQAAGAQLVTTEKDAVRLPAHIRPQVLTLPVRLELEDWAPLDAALARVVGAQ